MTDPLQPSHVQWPTVEADGDKLYRVTVPATEAGSAYFAVAASAVKAPVSVEADVPSRLTWKGNKADYVVIAPDVLMDGAKALASYRQGKKFATMVVDLEDIYDEFNYGIADPHAIQTFLAFARATWKTKPSYAVLAGNGTYDYKDYQGYGDNLLPPLMIATDYGLFGPTRSSRPTPASPSGGCPRRPRGSWRPSWPRLRPTRPAAAIGPSE